MNDFAKDKYNQLYKSIGFERAGLFELIKKEFNPKTVIYPGCSIHVTPSFYFNHTVFIDKGQLSADFFSNHDDVMDLINRYKTYRGPAYWQFIHNDFQADLGLRDYSFDLLLSLFSGKLIDYCKRYVKLKGLILTNSLFSDNDSIKNKENFTLLGSIKCKNFKYCINYKNYPTNPGRSRLRPKNDRFEYVDNEDYYIYQKIT